MKLAVLLPMAFLLRSAANLKRLWLNLIIRNSLRQSTFLDKEEAC